MPPKYSALKVGGRRAYVWPALVRGDAESSPRDHRVLHLMCVTGTTLTVEVTCSKGTYIRALARDLAASLDTVGHMSALTRTRVGPFLISDALTVDDIANRASRQPACLPAAQFPMLRPSPPPPKTPVHCSTASPSRCPACAPTMCGSTIQTAA